MTRIERFLAPFVFLALVVAALSPSLVWGLGHPLEVTPDPDLKEVDCSAAPPVTHQFRRDGIASYTFPGTCRAVLSDGRVATIRYHVDASWDPNKRVGIEMGRIYDLGTVAPNQL